MLQKHDPVAAATAPSGGAVGEALAEGHASYSWIALSALSGLTAVGLGAFGSHGLRAVVTSEMLTVWRTAVEYQMLHTLAMLALALAPAHVDSALWRWPVRLWAAGILLFSGSLYAMVLSGTRVLGIITPFGGVCFMAGWLLLVWAAWTRRHAKTRA